MIRTVVTREVEWDDAERAKFIGLVDYEASLCDCGMPKDYADQDPDLELAYRVCPVCAGLAKALRIQHHRDDIATKALGEKPSPDAPLPADGRHINLMSKAPPEDQPD